MRRIALYIHELENWTRFRWDQEKIATRLLSIRHEQGRLLGRMQSLGFPLQMEAALQTLTQDVVRSSEIEGELLNKDMVRSSLAHRMGVDIAAIVPSDRQVDGVVDMMLDATANSRDPLTPQRLFRWHTLLFPAGATRFSGMVVGEWRNNRAGDMQVVSGPIGRQRVHFVAPVPSRLPVEMQQFVEWFNTSSQMDLVLKAAIAHFWFVTIHPFADGNGRIVRAIADLMLTRSENTTQRFYSMSAQIQKERADYYDILESSQKGDQDITRWVEWFLNCLGRALAGAESDLEGVLRKSRFWEAHAGKSFNDRQRLILNRLLDGFFGKLTTSKWAKIAKCSSDTALRDIEDLLRRDVLTKDAGGGRSTSYSLRT
jgi:Fic family protein